MLKLRKGLLGIALLAGMLATPLTTRAADENAPSPLKEFLAQEEAKPASDVQVAQAEPGTPAVPVKTTGSTDEPPVGDGQIEMTFKESENDILTRAAMEKLNADIGSLTFKNTDLADVIRFIGRKLDLNFIFDADVVKGKITLTFRNVRVKDALDSILTAQKLALVPDKSGIFRIVPANRVGGQEVETRTEVIQLNWVVAADVAATMKPFLSKDGKLEINEASNVVIITDVPPNLENIKSLIARIDQAERQVMIEARLVDINIGAIRNLGTDWSVSTDRNRAGVTTGQPGAPNSDVLGVANILYQGASFHGGTGTIALGEKIGILGNEYNINAAFTFLEQRNIVQILANPRVSTLNNVPANIRIIQQIPYISAAQINNGTTTNQIEFKEAGVEIKVTPIITPNGFIRMQIAMNQKIFRGRVGSAALDPPLIDDRNAETNIIVQSGNTALLGGLRQVQNNEGVDGVPWLHRAPFFGWLFKNKNYDQRNTELVLMITPSNEERAYKPNEHEKDLYNEIDRKWHIPDRFMDDVSNADDDSYMQDGKLKK